MSLFASSRVAYRAVSLPPELVIACLHTSASSSLQASSSISAQRTAPSRKRLVKNLKPSSKGKLEVAPPPPPPQRDEAPHIGRKSFNEPAPRRRPGTRELELRRLQKLENKKGGFKSFRKLPAELPASLSLTPSRSAREPDAPVAKAKVNNPLSDEFDITNRSVSTQELPQEFTSPPLMDGLLDSVRQALGPDARPTPIQALSLKHLVQMERSGNPEKYHEYLLASETGSGKSLAYLLPMIQDLKQSELQGTQRRSTNPSAQRRAMNPRALVLAPTHELSRQLAGFAKELIHNVKLRVLCASRANTSSRKNVSAAKMAEALVDEALEGEMVVRPGAQHEVDIVVGTPSKVLELMRGRGWDKDPEEQPGRKVNVGEPQMGLANVEWVVVDEADVLFDPDFQEQTRLILSEVAAARGRPVPYEPALDLSAQEPATPLEYPFNFLLTSATIPSALAAYLDRFHPSLTRLASPNLHKLPPKLKTEFVSWTGGNRDADIEHQLRRVWATDAEKGRPRSKVLVFCNKGTRVEALGAALREKGIPNVALTKSGDARLHGSNHHLDGFLRVRKAAGEAAAAAVDEKSEERDEAQGAGEKEESPSVMITTSLLSRGLDFAPDVQHVFIVDEPRNMVDFLHRAGRSGRAGQEGKVVVFVKDKGRGSDKAREVQEKVGALQRGGKGARRKRD